MKHRTMAGLGLAAVLIGSVVAGSPSGSVAASSPSTFDSPQQNPYFPLRPGTVSRYRGIDGAQRYRETVHVTRRTKMIQGVETTVVRDVVHRVDGSLAEKTTDWYAPDDEGNVWYFGERTATYDEAGNLESTEGTWRAGRHGAVAGIIMPADPRPTDAYRQEFRRGEAEDQAWIVSRRGSTTVAYGKVDHVVRSFEWTRLEPQVVSLKLYGPGLGIVREKDVSGGSESFELVSVRHR